MTSAGKTFRNTALGLLGLIVLVGIATVVVVQTNWFRGFIRDKIITAAGNATGGKVDLNAFRFDLGHLRADLDEFMIHGTEPAGTAPFLRIRHIRLDIRFLTHGHLLDLNYLAIEQPEANIVVRGDGTTNIPKPATPSNPNKSALQTVVDLAIDRFDLSNGEVRVDSRKRDLNLRGENLRAQLFYNAQNQDYSGQLAFEPIYLSTAQKPPIRIAVTVPVSLLGDRIDVRNASITTRQSSLSITASVEHLKNPSIHAQVAGKVALVDLKSAGNLQINVPSEAPQAISIRADAFASHSAIDVTTFQISAGGSNFAASGKLKDMPGTGSLAFSGKLNLSEIGKWMPPPAGIRSEQESIASGAVFLNGNATLDGANRYRVAGSIRAAEVTVRQSGRNWGPIQLTSNFRVSPGDISLNDLRLSAFGGMLTGDGSLQNFAQYVFRGALQGFNIETVLRQAGQSALPYSGTLSGNVQLSGNLKAPGTSGLGAQAQLSITPVRSPIPISGMLNVRLEGAKDAITITNSFIALPHSRLTIAGAVTQQRGMAQEKLNLRLTTSDLNDFLAMIPVKSRPNVALNRGRLEVDGTVTGSLSSPQVRAHVMGDRFSVEGRAFDRIQFEAEASADGATVRNSLLRRAGMQATMNASIGLMKWRAQPMNQISANVDIQQADLADIVALARRSPKGYTSPITANVNINGTIGNPQGAASVHAGRGTIAGRPFDGFDAQVNMKDQAIVLTTASFQAGDARIDASGQFQHPANSFTTGSVQAILQTNNFDLSKVPFMQELRPVTSGMARIQGDISAQLEHPSASQSRFRLNSATASVIARNLYFKGKPYGDLDLDAHTVNQRIYYTLNAGRAAEYIRVNGSTQLVRDYPTTADVNVNTVPIEDIVGLIGRGDLPIRGVLSANAHIDGPIKSPTGNANVELTRAAVSNEPIDRVRLNARYVPNRVEIPSLRVEAGPSHVALAASYDHPADDLNTGDLRFEIRDSSIDLARLRSVQSRRPGLGGQALLTANGTAHVRTGAPRVQIRSLDVNFALTGLASNGKHLGNAKLIATSSRDRVNFTVDSDLGGSTIHGQGNVAIAENYPTDADITFRDITWSGLQPLIESNSVAERNFNAAIDGHVVIRGPASDPARLSGSIELTRLNVLTSALRLTSASRVPVLNQRNPNPASQTLPETVVLQNQGPLTASVINGVARIQSFHLTGPETNIQATGTVPLPGLAPETGNTINAKISGTMDLSVLQNFSEDIRSSGKLTLEADAGGTFRMPLLDGRIQLQSVSFNHASLPNGLSNANGTIRLSGNSAVIENLTGESGGGKVALSGFIARSPMVRYSLRANAKDVRIRIQSGVSIAVNSDVQLSGNINHGLASGTVTVTRITYAPQTDIASVLTRAAPPIQASAPSPLLASLKLDVRVRTTAATIVQSALAQDLTVDTDLQVRGTADRPGVLGRVNITRGELIFFGSRYTLQNGTISFFNPVRIEPVLDLSLATKAKGVDVTLKVSGPIDNMKLSYTSDPPLRFEEIVGLLAAGTTPTSDPTLLANQPTQPQQNFQQMGESAILSKAIADPIASRLKRVFGVSELKIDPSFVSGTELPQTRLTLQQQITNSLTFTYITNVNNANAQTVRAEFNMGHQWSATAMRDQNGIVTVNLFYKKQLR